MNRRRFLHVAALTGAAGATGGLAAGRRGRPDPEELGLAETGVDPYFLDSGDLSSEEQEGIAAFENYRDLVARGEEAVMPRGGKPKRAPTFRFLHWSGRINDPDGRFVGPMSLTPKLPRLPAFRVNFQILGLHTSEEDWKRVEQGTLSVEMRGRLYGEPLTWLFAQQFDLLEGGHTSIGLEHVAQREGVPDPVVIDEPNLDLRIQLLRHPKKRGILRKILKLASFVVGLPLGATGGTDDQRFAALGQAVPTVRVPMMLWEGVALSQALLGGTAQEKPLWRSAFNPYGLTESGSRLKLVPGLWVAVDDSGAEKLDQAKLQDVGGEVAITRAGKPIESNHLVLEVRIEEGNLAPG